MDGAHVGLEGKSPAIIIRLGWDLCEKTFFVGRVGVAFEATRIDQNYG